MMEGSESAALVDEWRNDLQNANGDIFENFKTAIMVAAADHPLEFRTKRDMIAQTLFSGELINRYDCYKCTKQSLKVSPLETEDAEALNNSVLIIEEGREWNNSHRKRPMEKQIVPTGKQQRPTMVRIKLNTDQTKFQIPNGPVTPEKKVDNYGARVYNQGVAEVLRMKKVLDKIGDESESESVVYDILKKLESMDLFFTTLEATVIGKSVSALKKHPSKKVRQIAVTLVKAWKRTVDEWFNKQSSNVELISKEGKATNLNLNTKGKLEGLEKASKIGNGGVIDSLEKLAATKRKLEEGNSGVESIKNQRRKAQPTMMPIKLNTKTKFQIQKGPVTPEKKVEDHGARVHHQEVAEVLKMKKILDDSGDESESELVVCDLLTKLQSMGLSYQTLKETMIGKTISGLKKHPSKNVCQLARTLVKGWRGTADEWIKEQSNHVKPTSQKVKPTNLHMNAEAKLEGSEKASKIGNGGVVESSEKFEATKRKLQEGYEKAENKKKKRRIQVMELHEVRKQGLLPQETRRINQNRRRVYWRC